MKLTLFLGAGASKPLGFPDTKEFKTRLEELLKQRQKGNMFSMLQRSGHEDIENVLTDIDKLMNLSSDRGYKLLQNTVDITYKENSASPTHDSLDDVLAIFLDYKKSIHNHVYNEYSWKGTSNDDLKLYDDVFQILQTSDDGIHICTTNYDLVMEHYIDIDGNGLARVDGFLHDDSTSKLFFDPTTFSRPPQNNNQDTRCYLYKLHGSLNWVSHGDKIRQRETDESFAGEDNVIIYPTLSSKDKNYNREPYKTMQSKFKARVKKTDVFIVIGYSFRDESINKEFKNFLRRDKTKMIVISPSAEDDTAEGLGSEEFAQCNLKPDPSLRGAIQQYKEKCSILYDDPMDSGLPALETILKNYLPDFDPNSRVYNVICVLEVIDCIDLLRTLHGIWES